MTSDGEKGLEGIVVRDLLDMRWKAGDGGTRRASASIWSGSAFPSLPRNRSWRKRSTWPTTAQRASSSSPGCRRRSASAASSTCCGRASSTARTT